MDAKNIESAFIQERGAMLINWVSKALCNNMIVSFSKAST